jgi:hypothetical protein
MDQIRLATPEDVVGIESQLDLTPTSTCVTFGGKDFAVIRDFRELGNVIFDKDTGDRRKLLFLMNLETALRLQGTKEIYMDIPADDEAYQAVMKNWGAEDISVTPTRRFKKVL